MKSNTIINVLTKVGASLALGAFALSVQAGHKRHIDFARVTDVNPIYDTVEHRVPRQSCWMESVREQPRRDHRRSSTGTIVGGIIGGALGNAVGHRKRNKQVGAVVGTLLGASIGRDVSRHHGRHLGYDRVSYNQVERCETTHTVETQQKIVGYDVDYRYRGQHYSTKMPRHPGKKIRVAVQVSPLMN